jgi:hypothetical protein
MLLALSQVVFTGCSGKEEEKANKDKETDAQVAEQIKDLIPEASSSPTKEWQLIGAASAPPSIEKIKNQSLSLVLMCLPSPTKDNETFVLDMKEVNPARLVAVLERSKDKGYGTLLQPEYLTECKCTVDRNKAVGTIAFRAEGLYHGKVEFSATRKDGSWRIEEFRLPAFKKQIRLGADGLWTMSGL